ncbi:MAG: DUF2147 domain-containing protein [Methyloligellaceae bacterium]
MKNSFRLLSVTSLLFFLLPLQSSYAGSPYGVWVRNNGVHIKVYKCKDGLGMTIVKATKKENTGRNIMCGAKKTSSGKWDGKILNVADNRTYKGTVTINRNILTLEGCVFGGLICKTDKWKRLKE